MYSFVVYLPVQILHIRVGHLSYSSYFCCTRISPEMSSYFVFFRFYSAEISCALNFLHERGEEESIAKYLPGQIEIISICPGRYYNYYNSQSWLSMSTNNQ